MNRATNARTGKGFARNAAGKAARLRASKSRKGTGGGTGKEFIDQNY